MTKFDKLMNLMHAMDNDDFDYRVDNGEYTIFIYSMEWENATPIYADAKLVNAFLDYLDEVATYENDNFNCPAEVDGIKIYIVFED